ncbi:unnamed protein product [Dibothriocephalus latus]|uniref:Uncharacterized protein n=1 Tax=Dibothriocephalus latus TaxID=60516 RepID=A0A3P6QVB4_DIBLA|nr:unnamed protein product [Dibothriocephalus latus]
MTHRPQQDIDPQDLDSKLQSVSDITIASNTKVNARAAKLLSNCQKFFRRLRHFPRILRKASQKHDNADNGGLERRLAKGKKRANAQKITCCKSFEMLLVVVT